MSKSKTSMKTDSDLSKIYLDQNIWDGEDRSGCDGDSAVFTPDDLQELFNEVFEFIHEYRNYEYLKRINDYLDEMGGEARSGAQERLRAAIEDWRVANGES